MKIVFSESLVRKAIESTLTIVRLGESIILFAETSISPISTIVIEESLVRASFANMQPKNWP
jgi:hypothetical protein